MDRKIFVTITYILNIGIMMIVPIFLMVGVYKLVNVYINIPFVIYISLGIFSGFRNCYILIKKELYKHDKYKRDIN